MEHKTWRQAACCRYSITGGTWKSFGFSAKMKGLLVNEVYGDGPAARAGIRRGDILVRMEGMVVGSLEEYRGTLSEYTPGDRLRLSLFRKGEDIGFSVQPSPFPLELAVEMVDRRMGIRVAGADQNTKRQYGLKDGLIIEKVRQGSEAGRVGLQPGDLLLKVNETAVSRMEDFQKAIASYHHLSSLSLFIRRGPYGFSITLAF